MGIHESNTIFLERCLHWRGIMIEAHPVIFERMMRNRPGLVGIGSAVCDKHFEAPFLDDNLWGGYLEHFAGENTVAVPCGPLAEYLRMLNIKQIHFFSLDVEGAEHLVLDSISSDVVAVDVMVVEELRKPGFLVKNARVRQQLLKNGLEFLFEYCWSTEGHCDAYFANSQRVDFDRVFQHLSSNPIQHGMSKPILPAKSPCRGSV